MNASARAAQEAIIERFSESMTNDDCKPITVAEAEGIALTHGVLPGEAAALAEDTLRGAMLTYLGVAWGVGPKASWRDRLGVRWRIFREKFRS